MKLNDSIINLIIYSKIFVNNNKRYISNKNNFKFMDISIGQKPNFLKPEPDSEKNQIYVQIMKYLHE